MERSQKELKEIERLEKASEFHKHKNYFLILIIVLSIVYIVDELASNVRSVVEVQTIKGVKNVLFGGEGLFNTKVTAPPDRPVRIWLQSMPIYNLAMEVYKYIPHTNN